MTICYLDPEDEITGAVARIRAVDDGEAILVLPPGSRIATSRINFRLLGREAQQHGLILVAVSDEPGVRALAVSAGVPAYDSIAAAEGGLVEFARQEERLAARTGRPAPPRGGGATTARGVLAEPPARPADAGPRPLTEPTPRQSAGARRERSEGTRVMALPRGLDEPRTGDTDSGYPERVPRSRSRRRRARALPLLAIALAVALIAITAYGAYVLLPTATITLRPHLAAVGPVSTEVVADPRVAVVDPGEGVVPAQVLQLPLSATADFDATGSEVTNTRATGDVRFRSTNTVNEVEVPAGTRVSTDGGVDFETTEQVTVPRADFDTSTPGVATAPIRARRAGESGNVGADSITNLPASIADQQVSVNNPQPTGGGARLEQRVIVRADYDAAIDTLTARLNEQLATALLDPALAPTGLTAFADSAQMGVIDASQPASELVGTVADTFDLALTTEASVLAVDELLVDDVALEQLRALVPTGSTVVEASLEASHAPGEFADGVVRFAASADGSAYRAPDRVELLDEVRGKTVAEARAIMESYGTVELSVWPDFVDRVPDQPSRINLTILPPTETT